jgi:hypothetical protein
VRKLLDRNNSILIKVLEALLAKDIDITVCEVARRHPALGNASSFTRNSHRMDLISTAQQRQSDARQVKAGPIDRRSRSVAGRLKSRNKDVSNYKQRLRLS